MQARPLSALNRNPFADTFEVFEGNATPGAFCLKHDRFADPVVDVSPKASLFTSDLPELPFGRSGFLPLEISFSVSVSTSHELDLVTGVNDSVGIYSQVYNPKVDAEEFFSGVDLNVRNLVRDKEKPLARASQTKVRLAMVEQDPFLPLVHADRDLDSPLQHPERYQGAVFFERQDPAVVGLGSGSTETERLVLVFDRLPTPRASGLLSAPPPSPPRSDPFLAKGPLGLVRGGHFCNAEDHDLGGKVEPFASPGIDELMQAEALELVVLDGLLRDPATGFAATFKGGSEERSLVSTGKQSDLGREDHQEENDIELRHQKKD